MSSSVCAVKRGFGMKFKRRLTGARRRLQLRMAPSRAGGWPAVNLVNEAMRQRCSYLLLSMGGAAVTIAVTIFLAGRPKQVR